MSGLPVRPTMPSLYATSPPDRSAPRAVDENSPEDQHVPPHAATTVGLPPWGTFRARNDSDVRAPISPVIVVGSNATGFRRRPSRVTWGRADRPPARIDNDLEDRSIRHVENTAASSDQELRLHDQHAIDATSGTPGRTRTVHWADNSDREPGLERLRRTIEEGAAAQAELDRREMDDLNRNYRLVRASYAIPDYVTVCSTTMILRPHHRGQKILLSKCRNRVGWVSLACRTARTCRFYEDAVALVTHFLTDPDLIAFFGERQRIKDKPACCRTTREKGQLIHFDATRAREVAGFLGRMANLFGLDRVEGLTNSQAKLKVRTVRIPFRVKSWDGKEDANGCTARDDGLPMFPIGSLVEEDSDIDGGSDDGLPMFPIGSLVEEDSDWDGGSDDE